MTSAQLNMSEPAVSKHVRVLVDAALVSKATKGATAGADARRSAFELARESVEELCGPARRSL
ncbi:MAG: hypothetical protein DMF21_05545 [Verrucomicrobia bacterium]|nr:MAG: hypothetical protein DMF21_05545 [Verrucomicrobiota bacterium]